MLHCWTWALCLRLLKPRLQVQVQAIWSVHATRQVQPETTPTPWQQQPPLEQPAVDGVDWVASVTECPDPQQWRTTAAGCRRLHRRHCHRLRRDPRVDVWNVLRQPQLPTPWTFARHLRPQCHCRLVPEQVFWVSERHVCVWCLRQTCLVWTCEEEKKKAAQRHSKGGQPVLFFGITGCMHACACLISFVDHPVNPYFTCCFCQPTRDPLCPLVQQATKKVGVGKEGTGEPKATRVPSPCAGVLQRQQRHDAG